MLSNAAALGVLHIGWTTVLHLPSSLWGKVQSVYTIVAYLLNGLAMQTSWTRHQADEDAAVNILLLYLQCFP